MIKKIEESKGKWRINFRLDNEEIFEYNGAGLKTKRIFYNYDENQVKKLLCKNIYEYNEKQQNVKILCYDEDNAVSSIIFKEYSEDGKLIKESYKTPSGEIKETILTTYTQKGYKESTYNKHGELCSIVEFVCNEKGDWLREIDYDWNKKKIFWAKCYYDSTGAPTKDIGYDEDGNVCQKRFFECRCGRILKEYVCYLG